MKAAILASVTCLLAIAGSSLADEIAQASLMLSPPATSNFIRTLPYHVTERGRDLRRFEQVQIETNGVKVSFHTNAYVELQTGVHYSSNGEWLESREEIQVTTNGAVANQGPHKVSFPASLPSGVRILTPDGKLLKTRILGMAFYDFHSRQQVLISELQDSIGQLIATNVILYTNAFTDFRADVRYTYRKSGLEQDIILRQRPPLPEDYNLNPETTRLLLLTEFIDPPTDIHTIEQIPRGWTKDKVAKLIDFGVMKIGPGIAFGLGSAADRRRAIPVEKHLAVLDGRSFIIEEVSFRRITPLLRD